MSKKELNEIENTSSAEVAIAVDDAEIAKTIEAQLVPIMKAKKSKAVKKDAAKVPEMTDEEIKAMQAETHETYKEMSPLRLVARRFFRSRLSIIGLIMIVALFLFSYMGPVVYNRWGEDEADQNVTVTMTQTITLEDGTVVEEVYTYNKLINDYAAPGGDHILGTDDKGMDVFTRLMYGGRISLMIGFIVVILETLIGVLLGGIAGYFGGWVDSVIMRIVDIFNCIPTLPILLIASAIIDGWIENGAIN